MDVSNILELVDMFDKFEKENGGQKAVITQLQNENKKLSLELKDMKVIIYSEVMDGNISLLHVLLR